MTDGIHKKGLFAYIVHIRDDYLVMVTEDVPSRKPNYIE